MPHRLTGRSRLGRLPQTFASAATTGPEAWPGWTGGYTQTIEGDDLIIDEGGTADAHRVISGVHMIGGTIHTVPGIQYVDIIGCLVEGWQPSLGGINLSYGDNSFCSIQYCRVSAMSDQDGTPESYDNVRLNYGLRVFADDLLLAHNEIFWVPDAIQIAGSRNQIIGNYVHNSTFWDDGEGGEGSSPGGDHNNCLLHNGGVVDELTITGNTFLLDRQGAGMVQTGALSLQQSAEFPGAYTNIFIERNRVAGGGYALYSGYEPAKEGNSPGTNFVVRDNVFSTRYFPDCGFFGPVTGAQPWGEDGNTWEGNRWGDGIRAGQLVPAP
ncbi:right-handed parallel beta-helix repeat-containing protein [Sphaerisporangium aureirubrum]|uniref:Right handed beta helix domain-containing protein n=1 Tax=Sphaerisporangium aureirubrum TaxID=1544736 RepID=A0ABW1NC67_9ACTN